MKATPDSTEELTDEDISALIVEIELLRNLADAVDDMMIEAEDTEIKKGELVEPSDVSQESFGRVYREMVAYNKFMDGGELVN
jgi:hypothetical protein